MINYKKLCWILLLVLVNFWEIYGWYKNEKSIYIIEYYEEFVEYFC